MCTVEMKGRALGSWSEEFLFLRRYMTVATMCQPAKHTCRPWVHLINYQSPWQRGSFWLTLALAAYFNIKVKRHRALHTVIVTVTTIIIIFFIIIIIINNSTHRNHTWSQWKFYEFYYYLSLNEKQLFPCVGRVWLKLHLKIALHF